MGESVKIAVTEHVAEVTLNRPGKHNAVNLEMFAALADAARQLETERSLRAVVLTGAGDHFCAGIDIEIFRQEGLAINADALAPVTGSPANLFQQAAYVWRALPVPVICAITGVAYGAGLQIALGADLRYAAPDARLSIMEIKWGLIPDMAISTTLRDILPADRVKELAWSGRPVGGDEALQLGLITALHADPVSAAREMAVAIASRSPDAIQATKRLINSAWRMSDDAALALEAELQLAILGSANQQEAVVANVEKRQPQFTD